VRPFGTNSHGWPAGGIPLVVQQLESGLCRQAIAECSRLLQEEPDNMEARRLRAKAYVQSRKFRDALDDQRIVAKLRPGYWEWMDVAHTCNHVGLEWEALEACAKALWFRPDGAEAHALLGRLHLKQGEWDKAMEESRTAIGIRSDDFQPYWTLGLAQIEKKDEEGALDSLMKAMRLMETCRAAAGRRHAKLLCDIGKAHCLLHHYRAAERCYQRAIQTDPTYPTGYKRLGILYYEWGSYEKRDGNDEKFRLAVKCLSLALESGDKTPVAYAVRGHARMALGNYEAAQQDYENSLQLDSRQLKVYTNLCACYMQLGKPEKVREMYERRYIGPRLKLH
jgi:tetratricopeptide (TPR) repeat protein